MKPETRQQRRDEIMDAAVAVLAERGYRDASMLDVARRASASKETLYAWFGSKAGLYEAVIRRNAGVVQDVLAGQLATDAPAERVLTAFGRALLELLLGEGAVAINRAAITEAQADPTLAWTLVSAGREATLPAFVQFLAREGAQGRLNIDDPGEAAADFLGLLLGDSQVRRLLGVLPPPDDEQIVARAVRASRSFLRLYAA